MVRRLRARLVEALLALAAGDLVDESRDWESVPEIKLALQHGWVQPLGYAATQLDKTGAGQARNRKARIGGSAAKLRHWAIPSQDCADPPHTSS